MSIFTLSVKRWKSILPNQALSSRCEGSATSFACSAVMSLQRHVSGLRGFLSRLRGIPVLSVTMRLDPFGSQHRVCRHLARRVRDGLAQGTRLTLYQRLRVIGLRKSQAEMTPMSEPAFVTPR